MALVKPAKETRPPQTSPDGSNWQRRLLTWGFYSLLIVIVAWPVVVNSGIGTAGHFSIDRNQYLWNFWWFNRSVLQTHTNPFDAPFLFYPYGVKLYLHAYGPYNLLIGLPLQLLIGLVPTFNLIVLATFPIGAYGGYSLARYLLGIGLPQASPAARQWGSLLAGLIWSFGPYHFVVLRMEWLNLISLQWIPFFVLFLLKLERATARREVIRYAILAGLFYLLTLLVDYYYALYLGLWVGLYWLWRAGQSLWKIRREGGARETERGMAVLTGKMALAVGLGLLPYSPFLYAVAREIASNKYQLGDTYDNQPHSTDLLQLFLPPAHQPLWGAGAGWWQGLGISTLNNWGSVLSYGAVGLSLVALIRLGRSWADLWFWVGQGLFWLVLSFGPTLRFNGGSTGVPMPYRWLVKLPIFNVWRFPERLIMMAGLSFAVLAAVGLAWLLDRLARTRARAGRWVAVGGVLALTLYGLESWPGMLPPPDPLPRPAFVDAIAATNGTAGVAPDKPILELPVTKHANPDSPRMLYQIYHARPITGGYISRKPIDPARFLHDYMLYDWIELRGVGPDIVAAKTPAQMRGLLNLANMGFVVVYPADFPAKADDADRAQSLINYTLGQGKTPPTPYYQDDLATIYRVPNEALTEPVAVLGQGWGRLETLDRAAGRYQRWLAEDTAEAHINLMVGPKVALQNPYTLQIGAVSPDKPRRMTVLLNGQPVGDVKVQGVATFQFPNLNLQPGDNTLALRPDPADGYYVPAQSGGAAEDTRRLRIGVLSVKLTN